MKLLRKKRKMSQAELAKEMDVTISAISRYEYGTRSPSVEYIVKFSKYFGVSTDYLLDDNAKVPRADIEPVYDYVCEIVNQYKKYALKDIQNDDKCARSDTIQALDEECNEMKYKVRKMLKELVK